MFSRVLRARLAHDARHDTGRLEFARCSLEERDDGAWVTLAGGSEQASGNVLAVANSDGLAMLDSETERFAQGDALRVLRWEDL